MDGSTLSTQAFEKMMKTFAGWQHQPSDEQKEGLKSIQETLTLMLLGKAANSYYLSSLDPGVGKSTAIIEWINAYLLHSVSYGNHGILICFDRLDEIKRFVDECNLPSDCYAVKVSELHDELKLNDRGLGSKNVNDALVLVTTKQQIAIKSKGKSFRDTQDFHYQGEPRMVRIWDESLVVGKELSIDRLDLLGLVRDISRIDLSVALKIDEIASQLKTCKNKEVFTVPSMGLSLNDMMAVTFKLSRPQADIAETLGMFLGRAVTVRTEDCGQVAIDCEESVPDDFVPCLVTDASGRVRETYNFQKQYRGNLIRLPEATKEYSNLTISAWRKASGKSAYDKLGYNVYADEVIKTINSRPEEEFLVVRHLGHTELESKVLKHVTCPDRVKFIHWGIHTATNKYADIPNVIITSPLTYRLAGYEALVRASAGLKTAGGVVTDEQLRIVKFGEHAHHLLQAICRGLVRKSEGSGCPESRVWIITSSKTMIEEKLSIIFPRCKVERWNTSLEALKGSQQKAYEYILKSLVAGSSGRVPSLKVRKHLGVPQTNFKRDILRNVMLNDSLEIHGIYIEPKGNKYDYVRDTFDYGVPSYAA